MWMCRCGDVRTGGTVASARPRPRTTLGNPNLGIIVVPGCLAQDTGLFQGGSGGLQAGRAHASPRLRVEGVRGRTPVLRGSSTPMLRVHAQD